jgi:isocitrate/isopropylmalate dehydrogenase
MLPLEDVGQITNQIVPKRLSTKTNAPFAIVGITPMHRECVPKSLHSQTAFTQMESTTTVQCVYLGSTFRTLMETVSTVVSPTLTLRFIMTIYVKLMKLKQMEDVHGVKKGTSITVVQALRL